MKLTKSQIRHWKSLIRRALIRNPNISSYKLAEVLQVDRRTALKYMNQVRSESAERLEKEIDQLQKVTVEEELAKMESELREVVKDLWEVISANNVTYKDRVNALRAVIFARKEMFNLKFDAGLFIKSLGKMDIDMADLVKKVKEVRDESGGDSSESSL